jgi:hypothetical protein
VCSGLGACQPNHSQAVGRSHQLSDDSAPLRTSCCQPLYTLQVHPGPYSAGQQNFSQNFVNSAICRPPCPNLAYSACVWPLWSRDSALGPAPPVPPERSRQGWWPATERNRKPLGPLRHCPQGTHSAARKPECSTVHSGARRPGPRPCSPERALPADLSQLGPSPRVTSPRATVVADTCRPA